MITKSRCSITSCSITFIVFRNVRSVLSSLTNEAIKIRKQCCLKVCEKPSIESRIARLLFARMMHSMLGSIVLSPPNRKTEYCGGIRVFKFPWLPLIGEYLPSAFAFKKETNVFIQQFRFDLLIPSGLSNSAPTLPSERFFRIWLILKLPLTSKPKCNLGTIGKVYQKSGCPEVLKFSEDFQIGEFSSVFLIVTPKTCIFN